jgi:hypothetical protein
LEIINFSILKQTVYQMAGTFGKYVLLVVVVGILSVIILKFLRVPNIIARPIVTVAILAAAYYGVGLIS